MEIIYTEKQVPTLIKKHNKCDYTECAKKLKLVDLPCRCEKRFCSKHRYSQEHDCSFDYKQHGINILSLKLIKCIPEKLIKI